MSRSYKKFIVRKDHQDRYYKRQASKAVRRVRDMPNGKRFKQYYCSWYICDWRFADSRFYTAEQFRRRWFADPDFRGSSRNWREAYRYWLRWYRMK